ncbi:MAG: glucosamine-6-phosphate isomerase [Clostridiales bacterium]|nr:glucosamine-6-phosphate isomerase [Clostridiales bacterium]
MLTTYTCSGDDFLRQSRIPVRILSPDAMFYDMARTMADIIKAKNGGRTVFICPVGPVLQYPEFAKIVNAERISLKNVWFFNMDEYLGEDGALISHSHSLSFRAAMDKLVYSRIDPELVMPPEQRLFPQPGHETEYDAALEALGGADACLTGVGINGHIAFNEPPAPDDPVTDEAYAALGTRCLPLAPETIVNNGARMFGGALEIFPKRCITLGLRQLLASRLLRVYLPGDWQWGIMRRIALEPASRFAPASFLQRHPNAEMVVTPELVSRRLL